MCGDLDEAEDIGSQRLYEDFLQAAHLAIHEALEHRGASRTVLAGQPAGHVVLPPARLHAYMDGLFAESLRDCIADSARLEATERYRLLAAQAVVMARLAGFMTGRLDRRDEPLRSSIEAMLAGYDA